MEYKKTKLKIRKGDIVKIITGESKGKQGKVLTVYTDKNRALVEGANHVKKHSKPSARNTQGGIITQESSIHISNLMLVDPKSGKPSRVGRRVENGRVVRFAKTSPNEIIKDNKTK